MDRPVVDQAHLRGGFDFDLAFTRDLPPGIPEGALINGAQIDMSGLTIFEAVQKQLGLRLERQKSPVAILVIGRAEKLAGNQAHRAIPRSHPDISQSVDSRCRILHSMHS